MDVTATNAPVHLVASFVIITAIAGFHFALILDKQNYLSALQVPMIIISQANAVSKRLLG